MNELLNEIYPDDVESLSEPEESVESVMYNVPEETTFYDEPSHENESEDTDIEEELPNSDRTVEDQDVLSSIAKKSFSSERCRFDEMSFYEKVSVSILKCNTYTYLLSCILCYAMTFDQYFIEFNSNIVLLYNFCSLIY